MLHNFLAISITLCEINSRLPLSAYTRRKTAIWKKLPSEDIPISTRSFITELPPKFSTCIKKYYYFLNMIPSLTTLWRTILQWNSPSSSSDTRIYLLGSPFPVLFPSVQDTTTRRSRSRPRKSVYKDIGSQSFCTISLDRALVRLSHHIIAPSSVHAPCGHNALLCALVSIAYT
jgi:hypothetical protein